MPFAVIEGGVFGSKVVGYGIARRKPAAHLLDAGLASLGSFGCCGVCGSLSGAARYVLNGKIRATFIVLFVK